MLSTFSGTYDVTSGSASGVLRLWVGKAFVVTLVGDQLMLQLPGNKIGSQLVPISDSHFVFVGGGAEIAFIKNADGVVTEMVFEIAEGGTRAARKNK